MNKLSKDKRDKLILVAIGVIGVLGALYTFVVGAQREKLSNLQMQISATSDKLDKAERMVRNADVIASNLQESRKALDLRAEQMVPQGQDYYWFLKRLDQFRKDEGLDSSFIVDITQAEYSEAGLLPQFPFRGAIFGVRANGYYEEIGKFLAELENEFPYMRVQNVRIQPQGREELSSSSIASSSGANEKLSVEFKVVTLIKPGTT